MRHVADTSGGAAEHFDGLITTYHDTTVRGLISNSDDWAFHESSVRAGSLKVIMHP